MSTCSDCPPVGQGDDVRCDECPRKNSDPHPKGAYDMDGGKLALVGCQCQHCTREAIRHDRGRYLGLDRV